MLITINPYSKAKSQKPKANTGTPFDEVKAYCTIHTREKFRHGGAKNFTLYLHSFGHDQLRQNILQSRC